MKDQDLFEELKDYILTFHHYGFIKQVTIDELYRVFKLRLELERDADN